MNLFPPDDQSIAAVSRDIREGRRSCLDVLDACLAQIDEWEPRVRAWVLVDRDGAREQARFLDAERAAGRIRGPLHGIPVGIKDIVDVAGLPTAAGFSRFADRIAREDAVLVARLRAAGAVIVGKTVTTQFASFDPPPTRNPWNVERTPGGSSSGSAAALACGMCLGAIGSQTGGSITRPASYCGVAGCKPTYGRVSTRGVMALAPSLDHPGPMARTVRDLAILLDAIAGYDPLIPHSESVRKRGQAPFALWSHDAWTTTDGSQSPFPDSLSADVPASSVAAALESEPLPPPRLGRLRGLFEKRATVAVWGAVESALDAARSAGAAVTDVQLPRAFDDVLRRHRVIMAVEAAAVHEAQFAQCGDEYLPAIRSLIEEGLTTPATEYARCRLHQVRLKREILAAFEQADVLVCPATTDPAPETSTTGDPAFNSPWSYTGLPTVSFPVGLSDDGLPLSLQLVGRPFAEADLFRAAAWCEDVVRSRSSG